VLRLRVRARDLRYRAHARRTRDLLDELERCGDTDFDELALLWRNPSAAHPQLLRRLWQECSMTTGPVLECGSGLSSLVLAIARRRFDLEIASLESNRYWARATQKRLRAAHLPSTFIREAPLISYGEFDWYSVPEEPRAYSLILCDGPPKETRGGRYGLVPVLYPAIAGARIILDDAGRGSEQVLLRRWQAEFGTTWTMEAPDVLSREFAVVTVPPRQATAAKPSG